MRHAVNHKMDPSLAWSGFAFIQAAFIIPLGTSAFAIGFKLQHAFTALQLDIGRVAIARFEFLFRQYQRKAASTLGTGRFDLVTFLTHGGLLNNLMFVKSELS
jgi:hypothetical protein